MRPFLAGFFMLPVVLGVMLALAWQAVDDARICLLYAGLFTFLALAALVAIGIYVYGRMG